jgi:hypothetical protein
MVNKIILNRLQTKNEKVNVCFIIYLYFSHIKFNELLRFVYIWGCFEIKAWKMSYYGGHLSKVQLSLRQYNVIQCFNATKHNLFPHLYPLLSWYFSMKLPSWNLKPDTVTCNA